MLFGELPEDYWRNNGMLQLIPKLLEQHKYCAMYVHVMYGHT